MAFELHGLLDDTAPEITLDSLASNLRRFFSSTDGFHLEDEDDPFDPARKNLLLSWGDSWWARVFIDTGSELEPDLVSREGGGKPIGTNGRIRVLFADDQSREYTNHVIFMMDFLGTIPGLTLFDPQRKAFL